MSSPLSVALATRNGAAYLPALLDSLLNQQLQPYELVVSDDMSDDDTLAIIETFALHAPFPVHILRNPKALGIEGNFAQAIAACHCPAIALADQDDIWRVDKLFFLSQALSSSGVLAAFSDAEVVDAQGEPIGYTMWQRVHFSKSERALLARGESFSVLIKHSVVTGATLAFKTPLRDVALPIPAGWAHDAWLSLIAAVLGNIVAVPEALIAYRQHETNAVGGRKKSWFAEAKVALNLDRSAWYGQELSRWHSLQDRLDTLAITGAVQGLLQDKLLHIETRASLPAARWRRFPSVLGEVVHGRYARFARNLGSAAIDLLVK